MEKLELQFEFEEYKKHSYRYKQVNGEELRTLYIQKQAIGDKPVSKLQVTIEEVS